MKKLSYEEQLVQRCVDIYERRRYYSKREGERKAPIHVRISDICLTYRDPFEYKRYRDIHRAVLRLIEQGILWGTPDPDGYFVKLRFMDETIDRCYQMLGTIPVQELHERMLRIINRYDREDYPLLHAFCEAQRALLLEHRKLIYGLDQNEEKMEDVLRALTVIEGLQEEMNIRAFSEELFGDPEWFEQIRVSVQNILYDYSEYAVEREGMLERFQLVDTPTYLHVKGDVQMDGPEFHANVAQMPGGMAVATRALSKLREVTVGAPRMVITTDQTIFYKLSEVDCAVLCLGGFPNEARIALLRLIAQKNPSLVFEYKGDIDVYGFLTLERLKAQTGIDFQARDMDMGTLQRYRRVGGCRENSSTERRLFENDCLTPYREVLDYMKKYNCKLEWRMVRM